METDGFYHSITQMASCPVPPTWAPTPHFSLDRSLYAGSEAITPHGMHHFTQNQKSHTVIKDENSQMQLGIRISMTATNTETVNVLERVIPQTGRLSNTRGNSVFTHTTPGPVSENRLDISLNTTESVHASPHRLQCSILSCSKNTGDMTPVSAVPNQPCLASTPIVNVSHASPVKLSPTDFQPTLSPIMERSYESIGIDRARMVTLVDKMAQLAQLSPPVED